MKIKNPIALGLIGAIAIASNIYAADTDLNKQLSSFYTKTPNNFELSCIFINKKVGVNSEYFITMNSYFNLDSYIKNKSIQIDYIELGPQISVQHCYNVWSNKINKETKDYVEHLYKAVTKILNTESLMLYDNSNNKTPKSITEDRERDIDQLRSYKVQLFDLMQQMKLLSIREKNNG